MSRTSKARRRQRISHPDELAGLTVLPWKRVPNRGQISIEDQSVGEETRKQWEARLNRLYFACGCPQGATGTLIALGMFVAVMLTIRPDIGAIGILATGGATTIVGGSLGKIVGLRSAERRLQVEIRDIREEWKRPSDRREEEFLFCG